MASSSRGSTIRPLVPDYVQARVLEYYKSKADEEREQFKNARSIAAVDLPEAVKYKQQEELLSIMRGGSSLDAFNFTHVKKPHSTSSSDSVVQVWEAPLRHQHQPTLLFSNRPRVQTKKRDTAQRCYDIMIKIDRFLRQEFQCPAVLNQEHSMKVIVQPGAKRNLCCWDPGQETVFIGNWDEELYTSVFDKLDVITHEFGHAVNHYSAGFIYVGESGALDESIADVFGIMHKHHEAKVNAEDEEASWLIGENMLINSDGSTSHLRSVANPGTILRNHPAFPEDEQIDHTRHIDPRSWPDDSEHRGGVYVYSGIPNRAFYLASTRMGGPSWKKPGQIWFKALKQAQGDDNFSTFATRTCEQARLLYDVSTQEIVAQAWTDVGVDLRKSLTPPAPAASSRSTQRSLEQRGIVRMPSENKNSSSSNFRRITCTAVAVTALAVGGYLWYNSRKLPESNDEKK